MQNSSYFAEQLQMRSEKRKSNQHLNVYVSSSWFPPNFESELLQSSKQTVEYPLLSFSANKVIEFYFFTTAADGDSVMECTMNNLQGFVNCVLGSVVMGRIYGQAFGVGEIKGNPAM